jgi:hypothetical protein
MTTVTAEPLLVSFKVAYRTDELQKTHSIRQSLASLAVTDIVKTILGEPHATELGKIIFSGNTVAKIICDISEDMCNQMTDELKNFTS